MKNLKKTRKKFAFRRGYIQVRQKDVSQVREELMEVLGVNTRMSLNNYMKGVTEPRVTQAEGVERVFAKYGIKDIWGLD